MEGTFADSKNKNAMSAQLKKRGKILPGKGVGSEIRTNT